MPLNQAQILARLSERHARIAASESDRTTRQDIQQTLDALDSKHSYYVVLSAEEREQIRTEWQALAARHGMRIAQKKTPTRSTNSAPKLPPAVLAFFGGSECLPHRPRAADDYTLGSRRVSWASAQSMRSIELNPPAHIHWLVFDCDHVDHNRWQSAGLPQPSFITINPHNGHHHVVYCLSTPVCRSERARTRPLEYLRAVQEAMRLALCGDPHYAGVLTKNPLHPAWTTLRSQPMPAYALGELAATVDLKQTGSSAPKGCGSRRARDPAGLAEVGVGGRNRALFDAVRQRPASCEGIQRYADRCNAMFPEPLPASEVIDIVASIERYESGRTGRKAAEAFRSRQVARGRLGGRPQTTAKSLPWLAVGVSRATWYRQQRASPPVAARQDPYPGASCPARVATTQDSRPWEALGISRASWYRRRLQDGLLNAETR